MRLFVGKLLASLLVLATVVLGGFAGVMILQWLGLATFDGARRGFPEIAAFAIGASVASAIAVLLFLKASTRFGILTKEECLDILLGPTRRRDGRK